MDVKGRHLVNAVTFCSYPCTLFEQLSQHGLIINPLHPASGQLSTCLFARTAIVGLFNPPTWGCFGFWRPETTCTVDMGGRQECVSVDRLKPAHLDLD